MIKTFCEIWMIKKHPSIHCKTSTPNIHSFISLCQNKQRKRNFHYSSVPLYQFLSKTNPNIHLYPTLIPILNKKKRGYPMLICFTDISMELLLDQEKKRENKNRGAVVVAPVHAPFNH